MMVMLTQTVCYMMAHVSKQVSNHVGLKTKLFMDNVWKTPGSFMYGLDNDLMLVNDSTEGVKDLMQRRK